jgi:hypothetical protein
MTFWEALDYMRAPALDARAARAAAVDAPP